MGAFGFSVRTGIEKVAARRPPPGIMPPSHAGHRVQDMLPDLNDLSSFQAAVMTPNTRLRGIVGDANVSAGMASQIDARMQQLAQSIAGAKAQLDPFVSAPHTVTPYHHPTISAASGQFMRDVDELQRLTVLKNVVDPTGSLRQFAGGTPGAGTAGAIAGADKQRRFQRMAQQLLADTRKAHGSSGVEKLLSQAGLSAAATGSPYRPNLDPAHISALSRGGSVLDAARGVTAGGPAPSAAPGFMARHGGKVLAGAGLLGGGLLLSNLMSKKRDEQAQGPYGPVYR